MSTMAHAKKCHDLLILLDEMESALRELSLWSEDPKDIPPNTAFLSSVPFCLDTMEFHQWLQYVFVSRMRDLISSGQSLPMTLKIHTVAEEYYRGKWRRHRRLLSCLRRVDQLFDAN